MHPPTILEAASRINQENDCGRTIRIVASARTYDQAGSMAESVANSLGDLLLGDTARIQHIADVQPDAPEAGTIAIILDR